MGHVELTEELSGVGEVYRKDGDSGTYVIFPRLYLSWDE